MLVTDPLILAICLAGGLMAGIASGMIGLGGGVIFIPVLMNFLPMAGYHHSTPLTIIATSLFAGLFSSGSSSFFHYRAKNLQLKEGLFLASGAILGSISASLVAVKVNPGFMHYFIAGVLLFVVIYLNFGKKELNISDKKLRYILPVISFLIGAISGMSGIGGGILFVPILAVVFRDNLKHAIGTSSFVVFITLVTGTISYILINGVAIVDYTAGILLAGGAIAGAKLGVNFLKNIKHSVIIKLFSLFLLINIIIIVF